MKQLINKIKEAIKLSGKKKWDEKNKELSKEINELLEGHEEEFNEYEEEFDEENEQLLKEINELFEGIEEGFKKVEEKYDQLLKEMDETINKYC